MNQSEPILDLRRKIWLDRLQALFEILLVTGLASSFLAALPFLSLRGKSGSDMLQDVRIVMGSVLIEAAITLLLLALILKAHDQSLQTLGLRWDEWKPNALIGLGMVPILFLVNLIVSGAFQIFLPEHVLDRNPLMDIIHTPQQLGLFIFSALLAGGVKEELQRAFILTRFNEHLGGAKLGLVLWSVAFGAGHYVQGLEGVVIAGILGFIFGAVYLVRGSFIAPMVAHGLYNTLSLLGYWVFARSANS